MIDTELNAGTACEPCRRLGHWCKAVIAMDAVPYCDACYDSKECETRIAHRIRLTGLGGAVDCNLSGPCKSLPLTSEQRKPFTDYEYKTTWRQEFERRSKESKKAVVNRLKVFRVRIESVRPARPSRYIPKPKGPDRFCSMCPKQIRSCNRSGRCEEHQRLPKTLPCKVEGCTGLVRKNNKYGACVPHWKQMYKAEIAAPRLQCKHDGCLEKINGKNKCGLCRWHGPWSNRSRYKATQPRMIQEAA